jgi:hypothetical protein
MKETANLPDTQIGTVARAAAHPQPLFSRILAPTDFPTDRRPPSTMRLK